MPRSHLQRVILTLRNISLIIKVRLVCQNFRYWSRAMRRDLPRAKRDAKFPTVPSHFTTDQPK